MSENSRNENHTYCILRSRRLSCSPGTVVLATWFGLSLSTEGTQRIELAPIFAGVQLLELTR